MTTRADATQMLDELQRFRRDLHAHPELGLQLPRTQEKVADFLGGLPLEMTPGKQLTSLTAVLHGGRPGPTVLLRGDMDALPVAERTGLDFASATGDMHACGHDLHTTMLAGAAHLLSARRDQLAGDVVFMFQPGEEGYDGARLMVEEGVLEASSSRPIAAYGLHVMSAAVPAGQFGTRAGAMLSASDAVKVTVRGHGGHGSMPHHAVDPVPIACEMVLALQSMITRRIDIGDPAVLTVGSIHGGTQNNVIPEDVTFEVTVRTFSGATHEAVRDGLFRVCRGIAAAHGADVDIDWQDLYPVTMNNAAEAEFAATAVAEAVGEENFAWWPRPLSGSEDFSRVLDEVPGAFLMLGATPAGADPEKAPNNHSAYAAFDDSVLGDGAAVYAELALRRLAAASA
ncbi:M20 metallopeptidase family protein [Tsukamurella pseudospumae]|uniref:Amidohydrolase n=1 Tax=Tsukamurella pseudospumae TaxID=239498 RepID=A0A137ZT25_9ACTN|nr:M20 family metallopeptidase [Tsukamurella pseudospumae]KXP01327.1 amidohydrolase [Tsukamurella pseudospumae]